MVRGTVLVMGDDTRGFLATVRSLGRQGIEVHAAPADFRSPALASRYVQGGPRHPALDGRRRGAGWRRCARCSSGQPLRPRDPLRRAQPAAAAASSRGAERPCPARDPGRSGHRRPVRQARHARTGAEQVGVRGPPGRLLQPGDDCGELAGRVRRSGRGQAAAVLHAGGLGTRGRVHVLERCGKLGPCWPRSSRRSARSRGTSRARASASRSWRRAAAAAGVRASPRPRALGEQLLPGQRAAEPGAGPGLRRHRRGGRLHRRRHVRVQAERGRRLDPARGQRAALGLAAAAGGARGRLPVPLVPAAGRRGGDAGGRVSGRRLRPQPDARHAGRGGGRGRPANSPPVRFGLFMAGRMSGMCRVLDPRRSAGRDACGTTRPGARRVPAFSRARAARAQAACRGGAARSRAAAEAKVRAAINGPAGAGAVRLPRNICRSPYAAPRFGRACRTKGWSRSAPPA